MGSGVSCRDGVGPSGVSCDPDRRNQSPPNSLRSLKYLRPSVSSVGKGRPQKVSRIARALGRTETILVAKRGTTTTPFKMTYLVVVDRCDLSVVYSRRRTTLTSRILVRV